MDEGDVNEEVWMEEMSVKMSVSEGNECGQRR